MRVSVGSGWWNRVAGVFGCIAVVVSIGGCARSRTPEPSTDGQSHWLKKCTSNGQCGEYECICGTCTRACSANAACAVEDEHAVCKSAEDLAIADRCEGDPPSISVCAAREEDTPVAGNGDAGGGASAGRGALGGSGTTGGGAGTTSVLGSGGSGGIVHSVSFTPDVDPPRLDCAGLSADDWPAGVELLHSFGSVAKLVGDDTAVYGGPDDSGAVEDEPAWRYREPGGPVEPLLSPGTSPLSIVADGDELFFSALAPTDRGLTKVSLSTGEQSTLVSDETLQGIRLANVDGGYVYWRSQRFAGEPGTTAVVERIERTDRATGATESLAELPGQTWALVALNGMLYVLGVGVDGGVSDHMQVLRMPADGSDVLRPFSPVAAIYTLERFGDGVYMQLADTRDELGNVIRKAGIAALDLEDGSIRMLVEEPNVVAGPVADDRFVYWASQDVDTLVVALWRMPKDGSGDAESLAHGWQSGGRMVLTQTALYWTIPCAGANVTHLLRLAKQ